MRVPLNPLVRVADKQVVCRLQFFGRLVIGLLAGLPPKLTIALVDKLVKSRNYSLSLDGRGLG